MPRPRRRTPYPPVPDPGPEVKVAFSQPLNENGVSIRHRWGHHIREYRQHRHELERPVECEVYVGTVQRVAEPRPEVHELREAVRIERRVTEAQVDRVARRARIAGAREDLRRGGAAGLMEVDRRSHEIEKVHT